MNIAAANDEAYRRILAAEPVLVDVRSAGEVLPGLNPSLVLHAGPPIAWGEMCGPLQGAVFGALRYEGAAVTEADAVSLIDAGRIAFAWTEEVVRYSIVWLVFLGGSIAARRGAHIAMDIVVVYLPARAKRVVATVVTAITCGFSGTLTYYGVRLTWMIWAFGQRSPAAEIPMALPFAALPVGCGLMTIRFLATLVVYLRGGDPFPKRAHLEA